jgi:hypothetical protein
MSFVKRFLRGEVTLWKSFWLVSAQPFLIILMESLYQFLIPREIYPFAYSYYSIITRLSIVNLFSLLCAVLVYGTWRSTSNYEGASAWKWLARLVLIFNVLWICLGLLLHGSDLIYIDPKYFPYELNTTS